MTTTKALRALGALAAVEVPRHGVFAAAERDELYSAIERVAIAHLRSAESRRSFTAATNWVTDLALRDRIQVTAIEQQIVSDRASSTRDSPLGSRCSAWGRRGSAAQRSGVWSVATTPSDRLGTFRPAAPSAHNLENLLVGESLASWILPVIGGPLVLRPWPDPGDHISAANVPATVRLWPRSRTALPISCPALSCET
jgi:hypothetical protein